MLDAGIHSASGLDRLRSGFDTGLRVLVVTRAGFVLRLPMIAYLFEGVLISSPRSTRANRSATAEATPRSKARCRHSRGRDGCCGFPGRRRRPESPPAAQNLRKQTGGDDGNRTHVQGFAGPCLNHSATSPCQVTMPRPGQDRTTIRLALHDLSCRDMQECWELCSSTDDSRESRYDQDRSTGLADRPSS